MYKIILISCLSLMTFSIAAQTINKPVIIKRTATWCTFCGGWGWNFMNDVEAQINNDQAVKMKMHFSGDLKNDLNVSLANNFAGSGQPLFYLNNDNQFVSAGNRPDKLSEIIGKVEDINNQAPNFEINMSAFKHSDSPAVTANITIEPNINDFEQNYYVALYLLEDNVLNTQAGRTGIVKHHNVIRSSFSATPFGELFMPKGGNFNGDPLNFEYTLDDNDPYITSDYQNQAFDVAAIIYSNDGGNYIIEQAEVFTNVSELSSSSDLVKLNDTKLYIDRDQLIVELDSEISLDKAEINIWNINGQNLYARPETIEKTYYNTIQIPLYGLANGQYVFSIAHEGGIWSRSFLIAK